MRGPKPGDKARAAFFSQAGAGASGPGRETRPMWPFSSRASWAWPCSAHPASLQHGAEQRRRGAGHGARRGGVRGAAAHEADVARDGGGPSRGREEGARSHP